MTRTEAYLVLNLLPKIGPVRVRRLIERFGTPELALAASSREIMTIDGFSEELAATVSRWKEQCDLETELRRIGELNLRIITQEDELYPPLLKTIHDPPVVLYVMGDLAIRDHNAVGVVGSRGATSYGMAMTKKLSFQISYAGYTVISGLARGIDTAAHEAALAAKGRTVGVLGSGIGAFYPPENQALAEKMAESGAVVSEYPVDRIADKQTFPYRNRIVAGWSCGLLVVEAPARSGSLITAQQAVEQGRTVYAVPGNIDRPTSMGCNRLIQQGARLVTDGADILDDLNTLFPTAPAAPKTEESRPAAPLTLDEEIIFRALGTDETHINELITRSGLTPATVSSTLMRLEMKRVIRPLPGKRYTRLV